MKSILNYIYLYIVFVIGTQKCVDIVDNNRKEQCMTNETSKLGFIINFSVYIFKLQLF